MTGEKPVWTQDELMQKIRAYYSAANDMVLYLDTHPEDKKALEIHKELVNKVREYTQEYGKTYAPINSDMANNPDRWEWVEGPWPWDGK